MHVKDAIGTEQNVTS